MSDWKPSGDDLIVTFVLDSPTKDDVLRAMVAWFEAEDKNLGTFHDRMELCNYVEWGARKVLGERVGPFSGVPKLVFEPRHRSNES